MSEKHVDVEEVVKIIAWTVVIVCVFLFLAIGSYFDNARNADRLDAYKKCVEHHSPKECE